MIEHKQMGVFQVHWGQVVYIFTGLHTLMAKGSVILMPDNLVFASS